MPIVLRIFLFTVVLFQMHPNASGQLTVSDGLSIPKPGYIDNPVLVVEPHGGYVAQSLYLSYSDHGQLNGSSRVEIVHRFRMPIDAVINNVWLWMGDSVIQAIMLSTWSARTIYDSIRSSRHNLASLSRTGDIYELHIFPLHSGSYRKVRIDFIAPTRWLGRTGRAELPLKLLQDDNNATTPLEILLRVVPPVWGEPRINNLSNVRFTPLTDTNGHTGAYARLDDIRPRTFLQLDYATAFDGGVYVASARPGNNASCFQFGFDPGSVFALPQDSSSRHLLFALDLSGAHEKNFATLIPNFKQAVLAAARTSDSVKFVVAGAGEVHVLRDTWTSGEPNNLLAIIDSFAASDWGKNIATRIRPHILYTGYLVKECWQFPGLDTLATHTDYWTLLQGSRDINRSNIVASTDYGETSVGSSTDQVDWLTRLDTLFFHGGRVLGYYDHTRGGYTIASPLIPGLGVTRVTDTTTIMYRNISGNIGKYFPESFPHGESDYLFWAPDPLVKVEVQDALGRPVVISRKARNGLLVVSSISSFRDDGALRALLGVPLLGLNTSAPNQMLAPLLSILKTIHAQTPVDNVFLFSNADSLVLKSDAETWTNTYFKNASLPPFHTINLLSGVELLPAYFTEQQVQYYGSGYLLKTIADASGGRHFESHLYPWNTMCALLDPYRFAHCDSLTATATVDAGAGTLMDIREVDPTPGDANKPRFFIGTASLCDSISFHLEARFANLPGTRIYNRTMILTRDSTRMDNVIPPILATEPLKQLLDATVRDTAAIAQLAVRNRLLCEYTAFLALEPNDTLHLIQDPFAAVRLVNVPEPARCMRPDSPDLSVTPNPFRDRATIALNIRTPSRITLGVYDALGRLVRTLVYDEVMPGSRICRWDGTDEQHRALRSGVYILRLLAEDRNRHLTQTATAKVVFMK
jgi:hypothetical protein